MRHYLHSIIHYLLHLIYYSFYSNDNNNKPGFDLLASLHVSFVPIIRIYKASNGYPIHLANILVDASERRSFVLRNMPQQYSSLRPSLCITQSSAIYCNFTRPPSDRYVSVTSFRFNQPSSSPPTARPLLGPLC